MNAIFYVFALLNTFAGSEIILYRRDLIFPERPTYLTIAKFSAADAPNWPPGNGHSFIDLSHLTLSIACNHDLTSSTSVPIPLIDAPTLPPASKTNKNHLHPTSSPTKFEKPKPNPKPSLNSLKCTNTTVEFLIFEAPTEGLNWQSYWASQSYCCTQESINKNKCKQERLNNLIIPPKLPGTFEGSVLVSPGETSTLTHLPIAHMNIHQSGVYVILVAICEPESSPVELDGPVESINPYGYLPAELFGNLPFYGSISCAYAILGVIWVILCIIYSKDLLHLQLWFTAVLALSLAEAALIFGHYIDWNDSGVPSTAITVIGLLFGVSKRAMSRIIILMVSMGYGVVRPSLGEDFKKIIYLGGSYYILSIVFTLASNGQTNSHLAGDPEFSDLKSLLVFMLAMVDTTFYIWTLVSLHSLITTLRSRQQNTKLQLYERFRIVLFFSLTFSCSWAIYALLLFHARFEQNWRSRWTSDAIWEISYFIIFVSIAYLWAPSRNSQRYAYSVELSQLDTGDDDEDGPIDNHVGFHREELDDEYGGPLPNEDENPFIGHGALDPAMAIMKKA